ncbi:DUF5999 family protein [Streptomyces sp. NPDC051366]|uniref:DUF5999 family protein n=1 Tax=Streptomyces sp. NPDC051366 TaxID=3365652 RepID=UPI0037B4241B
MCQHTPPCPSADSTDGEAARTLFSRPENTAGPSRVTASCSSRLCRSLQPLVSVSWWFARRTCLCRVVESSPVAQLETLLAIVCATWVGER